ncbi:MAG: acetyl-CoA carboxylase biotin carboxylase subunit family protein, partial [Chloroflexota bacterium]
MPAPRVLVLYSPSSYRGAAFLDAASRLGYDAVPGIDLPTELADHWGVSLSLDFTDPAAAVERITALHADAPFDAVLAVDDRATLIAATAADSLGLAHNDPASALAARDKWVMRQRFAAADVPVPRFTRYPLYADPVPIAESEHYPCVVKPLRLSGSRGVIRADTPQEFLAAWNRTRAIIEQEGIDPEAAAILVEEYLPGVEVAVEALLT